MAGVKRYLHRCVLKRQTHVGMITHARQYPFFAGNSSATKGETEFSMLPHASDAGLLTVQSAVIVSDQ
jgi:hypothetical protein